MSARVIAAGPLADPVITDEEILAAYREGVPGAMDILLKRFKSYARAKARPFFFPGADREDVVQEALIGLYKAIRDYDPQRNPSFRGFADVCITRHLIAAVKGATRQKHLVLNSYVSLVAAIEGNEGDETTLAERLPPEVSNDPADVVMALEELEGTKLFLKDALSPLEGAVLKLYLEGVSAIDIAKRLRKNPKSVDNALQRIRRKLESRVSTPG